MIDQSSSVPITANGEFQFEAMSIGSEYLVGIAGNFGGGSVTPGYADPAGNFVPYRDSAGAAIARTAADGWRVDLNSPGRLAIKLTGAAAPSLTVTINRVP